jgi:hypothetical protein
MSPGTRRNIESFLLLVVIVLGVLAAIRLATRDAAHGIGQEGVATAGSDDLDADGAGPPPSAVCRDLLARIRSCSQPELETLVDKMGPIEAWTLYKRLDALDRERVFNALPVPLVARKAHELLGVPEGVFRQAGSAGSLASSLVDAAMGVPRASAAGQPLPLSFATAVDAQNAPLEPRITFRPDERRIHACLDPGPEAETADAGVLVRWTEEGPGTVMYLRYLPFSVRQRWNYVYLEPPAWAPGTYRVQFYRVGGASVLLLAEGTYVVGTGS